MSNKTELLGVSMVKCL